MEIKHSPGPWTWWTDPVSGARRLCRPDGSAIFWPVPEAHGQGPTDINVPNDADVALISDAPALLDALAHARECQVCGEGFPWSNCPQGAVAIDLLSKHGRI